ncbi:SRPBCC family protein [Streptomyces sp. NPDC051940]|uniref:SRPBCC family protein n=1 Tax=Streptomyces sp. NPDC051940 TaxID=3155675 RepID=UPI00341F7E00
MAVFNVHERLLPVPPERLAPFIDRLGTPDDGLWPADSGHWPAMVLDRAPAVGARGGHWVIRYTVTGHAPGQWVRFRFDAPRGLTGFHDFALHPLPDGTGTVLRHTMAVRLRGPFVLLWPLAVRWLHDALLEDALDRAERAVTGTVARPNRWSPYVRLLRSLAARRPRGEGREVPARA